MKKVLAALMALLMLSLVLVSCADTKDNPGNETTAATTSDSSTTETEASTVDANGFILDSIPDNLNFGKTVTILYWSDVEQPEFDVEDITGDIVKDAIYGRNLQTEQRLGIKLEWIGTPGNFGNQNNFVTKVLNSISSGGEHDIFSGYSMTGATLAVNGYALDMNTLNYLDFEKPWWPQSLIGKATINGKLYFASGDISTNMLHMMYAVFFNKQMIVDYNLDNPYELVSNGQWTHTKMFEMSTGIYDDLNGDQKKDINDRYGFATSDIHYDAFFTGAGLNTVEKNANDALIMSPTFNSETTLKLLENICNFMWNGTDGYHGSTGQIFALGNTLFTLDRSYMALLRKDDLTFEYGILPVPKFDEVQQQYVTCLGFPYTMYAISVATKDQDVTAAALEVLCSEGYRQTTPMLFETTMKYKYTSDNDSAVMYDIIRSSVSIDIGRIFTTELGNLSYSLFRNTAAKNTLTSWASDFKMNSKVFEKHLEKINNKLTSLDS